MNRWYFWVLAPIMLATGLGLPFITNPPTPLGKLVLYVFCGGLVLATLGLARPRRFRWALQVVAGIILVAYVAYTISEFIAWRNGKPFGFGTSRASADLFSALCGLVVFGVPSLAFLLRGRSGASVDVLLEGDQEPDQEK